MWTQGLSLAKVNPVAVQASLVIVFICRMRFVQGLSMPQCERGVIKIDTASSSPGIRCEGADRSERIQWAYDDHGVNSYSGIFCEPSGSCTDSSAFRVSRPAQGTYSILTPSADFDTFGVLYNGMTVTCSTVNTGTRQQTQITSCDIDLVQSNNFVGSSNFSIEPQRVTLTPNASTTVTFTCATPRNAGYNITLMEIKRQPLKQSGNTPQVLVVASYTDTGKAQLQLQSLQGAVNVSGGIANKSISLTMNRFSCNDDGLYLCSIRGTNTRDYTYKSVKSVTAEVNPGPITMDTPGTGCCSLGQTMRLTCGQFVKTYDNSSQHNWVWEFKGKNAADWQSYAVIGDPTADITQRQPPSTDPCYTHTSSSLTRRVTAEDTDRQWRCYVEGNGTGQGVDMAKGFPVGADPGDGNLDGEDTPDEEDTPDGQNGETGDNNQDNEGDNVDRTDTPDGENDKDDQDKKGGKSSGSFVINWLAIGVGVAGVVFFLCIGLFLKRTKEGRQNMTPAPSSTPAATETAMITSDPADVGQSGPDTHIAVDDAVSKDAAAPTADTVTGSIKDRLFTDTASTMDFTRDATPDVA